MRRNKSIWMFLLSIYMVFALAFPVIADETAPADASPSEGDLAVVSGDGITFRLFNYSEQINKNAEGTQWRPITSYFTFRNSAKEAGTDVSCFDIPSPNMNTDHDQDGYNKYHATVERTLDENGMPVLDLSRNADGSERTDPGLEAATRSLSYLFSNTGDHAVTAYSPSNTILQKIGTRYLYKSSANAVDFDSSANCFRVRSYAERNSRTASSGGEYGDFLPFTYTGGNVIGTNGDGVSYHVATTDTDYWFGMTMDVNFFQSKGGMLDSQEMVFHFSGDDDVWVFVDDVLVLDLGGTHGTVDGTINFATGEVQQYLSWGGANATEEERQNGSETSFPTTIRACFDAAGRTPNGGWNGDGTTFADYTEHTLKFFYLERGAAVANCILDFRLPTLPDKSLTVTKELTGPEGDVTDYLKDTLSYRFRIMKADGSGNSTGELFLAPGTPFDLLENGVKIRTETLDEDGCFSLKDGQSAQFTEMLRKGEGSTAYIVEEILPDDWTGQYSGVEYLLSGNGGEIRTEDGPAEGFTAFQTGILSAEETQVVTFRNKVDTAKLGHLQITKQLAEGAAFPPEQRFRIRVMLGDSLLPVGSGYLVGSEERSVTEAGILELATGETAILTQGILSGTTYEITELGAGEDGFYASYHGTVTPDAPIECTEEGVTGLFPLGGTVQITVTNADYAFPLRIPLRKEALDNQDPVTFFFQAEQATPDGNGWSVIKTLPNTSITVTDHQVTEGSLVIGLPENASGIYYFRVREIPGNDGFLYDDTFYILEVIADQGTATVTALLKNGTEALSPDAPLSFRNRKTTSLTVTKTVSGYDPGEAFPFTATVLLDGQPFPIAGGNGYTAEGNQLFFSLGHGQSVTIHHIPVGAVVTVAETSHPGYSVTFRLESIDASPQQGNTTDIYFGQNPETIHFTNTSGYQLPLTGGLGTDLYTAAGLLLIAVSLLLYIMKRKGTLFL